MSEYTSRPRYPTKLLLILGDKGPKKQGGFIHGKSWDLPQLLAWPWWWPWLIAAVFGAMSLTNPAFAAVGAPADAELAERTFSPQAAPTLEIGGNVGGKRLTG